MLAVGIRCGALESELSLESGSIAEVAFGGVDCY